MNEKLYIASEKAIKQEFSWLDEFDVNLEYSFSTKFTNKIKKINRLSDFSFVSIGRIRIRRIALIAAILIFLLGITVSGIVLQRVIWNETKDDELGVIYVTFDLPKGSDLQVVEPKIPVQPDGYVITEKDVYDKGARILYNNTDGHNISYVASFGLETSSIGIDIKDASFKEIKVNIFKGYCIYYHKTNSYGLYWVDDHYFYLLTGTCSLDTLKQMAESIYRNH